MPEACDSETPSVGGSDRVDTSVFDGFDYVALGHLHGPQKMGRDTIRYAGSPLKYSLSETGHHKSFAVVAVALLTSTLCSIFGLQAQSRIIMIAIAVLLMVYLALFTLYTRKHPRRIVR